MYVKYFLVAIVAGLAGALGHKAYNEYANRPLEPAPAVATVGGVPITADEFLAYMVRRGGGFPGQFADSNNKRALLDELIRRELQLIRAREAGYAEDPEVVATLERILVGRLRADRLEQPLADISVSDAEIEQYYRTHIDEYTTPAMSRVALVYLYIPTGADDERRARVIEKAKQVRAEALALDESVHGFGPVAARHSEDQASRYTGGDVGWVNAEAPGRIEDPAVLSAALALDQPGQVSPVIEGADGVYLVRLIDLRERRARDLAEVAPAIRHGLLNEKRKAAEATWLASLEGDDTTIEINESVLESVTPPGDTADRRDTTPPALPRG